MELKNGRYQVQGLDLLQLGEQFGLPLYVYDGEKIHSQINRLKSAFAGADLRLKYAMKALSTPGVLQLFKNAGVGLDAVSIEEVRLGLKVGFAPQQIMFTTSCLPFCDIEQAVELGVVINLDSIPAVAMFGERYGSSVPLCVRLNPHIRAGGNAKIQTGHKESKFGISIEQLDELLTVVERFKINVSGLHVHTGSDILDPEAFIKGQEVLFQAAVRFRDLQFIDFGGGFKVAYAPGDQAIDLEELGPKMVQAFNAFCRDYGKALQIWFEPGKFMVSEAGLLLVETTVVKQTPNLTFAGVNSGLNHLIRPMMYDAYHHITNLSNPTAPESNYNVVGYICETDTFGSQLSLNEVRRGDVLAIMNAGAYGYTMSSNYNSKPRPAELLIYQGQPHLLTHRETFEDVLKNYVFNLAL